MPDPLSILIVDDEMSMRTTLEDILSICNYKVFCAEDGRRAIDLVKTESIELVLMDFKMPGINGVQTFREIIKIAPDIKTIFMTAFYDEVLLQEALGEGAVGVFHKPLNMPELLEFIKKISR